MDFTAKYELTTSLIELALRDQKYRIKFLNAQQAMNSNGQSDLVYLEFEIIGLCQFPAYDIRPIEPLKIEITGNSLPIVFLRSDFPTVPHMNIHSDCNVKSMCYSEIPFNELEHKLNGRFLIECINNWFLKTARNELHQQNQPLEPFFPYVKDTIILDFRYLDLLFCRFRKIEGAGGIVLLQDDEYLNGENFAIFKISIEEKQSGIIHVLPKTLKELLDLFQDSAASKHLHDWLKRLVLIKANAKEYNIRFGQSDYLLQNCKCLFLLQIPLKRDHSGQPENYDFRAFVSNSKLSSVIRNFGCKVNKSKLEYDGQKDNYGSGVHLEPYNVQFNISSFTARVFNGQNIRISQPKVAIIGVGALGSHIISNCVHSGFGEWTIIDDDVLWPHNISRHVLARDRIGQNKALALADAMKAVTTDVDIRAVNENIFDMNQSVNDALINADIIIDASASLAVERFLANTPLTSARTISLFMNPQGSSTVVLFEDVKKSIRLDLLEMQYYGTLLSNEKYAEHLRVPESLSYSGTCRSITSRLSQDNVALSAAICCKILKENYSREDAFISIITHEIGNFSQDNIANINWEEVVIGKWKVYISLPLLEKICSQRLCNIPNETGGVLVGAYDYARKLAYLVDHIESPDDSIASPTSYIRGCHGLEQRLKDIETIVLDNLYYIGEWHSHTGVSTQMSSDDKNLLSAIVDYNRQRCLPSCMLIVGSSSYSIMIDE